MPFSMLDSLYRTVILGNATKKNELDNVIGNQRWYIRIDVLYENNDL